MNSIKTLSISGFKSIREMKDFELRPLNVLIGANGAGKSNLVSFFRMIQFMMKNALKEYTTKYGRADSLFYNGIKVTDSVNATLSYQNGDEVWPYEVVFTRDYTGAIQTPDELITFRDKKLNQLKRVRIVTVSVDQATPKQQSSISDVANDIKYPAFRFFRERMSGISVFQFTDTSRTSALRNQCRVDDNHYLFEDGGNVAAILYYLRERKLERYRSIIDTIRLVYPTLDELILEPDKLHTELLDFRWKEKGNSYEFRPYQLSDGTLRFMALVTLLKLPQEDMPSLVIIDEPELGLHPSAITVLADLLKAASMRTQIIVSTQSVSLVNYMNVEDVIVVEKEDDQSVFKHLNRSELSSWLEDYTLGELWEKNVIGGRP